MDSNFTTAKGKDLMESKIRSAKFTQLSDNYWKLIVDSDKKYYGTKIECEIKLIVNHCGFGRFNTQYYPQITKRS